MMTAKITINRAALIILMTLGLAACFGGGGGEPAAPVRPSDIARDSLEAGLESFRSHNYGTARMLFQRSYDEFRSFDDVGGMTAALMNHAEIDLLMGESDAAGLRLSAARRLVDRDGLSYFGPRLAYMEARQAQQADDAERAMDRVAAARSLVDEDDALHLYLDLLEADLLLGSDPEAAAASVAALIEATEDQTDAVRARVHRLRADLAITQGDTAAAEAALGDALATYQAAEYRPGIAATHEAWAAIHRENGDWARVEDHLSRAISVRLWMNDRVHTADDLKGLAEAVEAGGADERASQLRRVREYLQGASNIDWGTVRSALAGF
jgi:tetratricopeptide (TPR) repeat protein